MDTVVNGARIWFSLEGQGPTLVLIHALGLDSRMWATTVPVFSRSFQVLTYDVRGHGRSEAPDRPGTAYSIELLASDLRELLRAIGVDRAAVLGISMGGFIAQRFGVDYPEMARALVLVDTSNDPGPEGRQALGDRAATAERDGMDPLIEPAINRWFTPEFQAAEPGVIQQYKEVLAGTNPLGYAACARAGAAFHLGAELSRIQCPVLVVHGDRDLSFAPEHAYRLKAAIPNARLVVLPDASHIVHEHQPQRFNDAVLAFLREAWGR